jgi:ribonuclease R
MLRNSQHINNKGKKITVGQLAQQMVNLFSEHPKKKYNARTLIEKLKIANSKDSVLHTLKAMAKKEFLIELDDEFFQWNKNKSTDQNPPKKGSKSTSSKSVIGRVDLTRTGAGFIVVDGEDSDVYVPERFMGNAMNRDTVRVELMSKSTGKRREGKIVEIVKRGLSHVLGTLRMFKNYGIVYPDASNRFPEVLVKAEMFNGAVDGNKVVLEITEWGTGQNKSIWGKVNAILADESPNEVAMQSILLEAGFDLEFPEEVIRESEEINGTITEFEIAKRRDFRDILTFTIDPETAKDFDDAISYQVLDNGNVEIGVHIADVSHYLKENTALDKEAFYRSTSVYLVDRCLPMLPEKLSNDLCSLNPHEDKLTFSAVFIFSKTNKIIDEWFGRTIIHSARRFTYEEAQERLESGEGDLATELRLINTIAQKLRKDKYKNGAINFDSEEVRFELDENKKPIAVYVKERKDAHLLIEDFMLLANKSVAKFMAKKGIPEVPAVYRTHDMPDSGKLADFALYAREMGYRMKIDTPANIAVSLNGLAEAIDNDESLKILGPMAIRTMAKAEYSIKNIGHYGLAFEYYTHFTSPIRRYSDVLVHRLLFDNLEDKIKRVDATALAQKCKHISKQEIKASEAERESIKYKQVEYMMGHLGDEFIGQVNGMIDKGFFVEVRANNAEGMVPFSSMITPYKLDESKLKAYSKGIGHEIKMGDKVRVKLVDADLTSRRLEFEYLGDVE